MVSVTFRLTLRTALAVLLLAAMSGCAGSRPDFAVPPGADDPLTPARAALASGNELKAIERLNRFLQENPGSILIDEANYLLGQAHLAQKDRVLAADYFQKVTRDFPQSRFAPDAAFYQANCYDGLSRPAQLDQDWTERAIGSYRNFVGHYPDHARAPVASERIAALTDRLAEKAYENAVLYLRMKIPSAAEVYFNRVLNEFGETKWACRAALGLGEVQMKKHRWRQATEQLQRVLDTCPDPELKARADRLMGKARGELARLGPAAPDSAGPADSAAAPRPGS